MANATHTNTDYGFSLVLHEGKDATIELYGLTGFGRFELFASLTLCGDDDIDDAIRDLIDENHDDVELFRATRKHLFGDA